MKNVFASLRRALCCGVIAGFGVLGAGQASAQTSGACCVTTASGGIVCTLTTEAKCHEAAGVWHGNNSACANTTCVIVGACCVQSAAAGPHCVLFTKDHCAAEGGVYFGDNTVCASTACPPPTGACCLPPTSNGPALAPCQVLTHDQCAQHGGTWKGAGVPCGNDTCPPPPPRGACCLPIDPASGTAIAPCQILTNDQCLQHGGTWKGANIPCTNDGCPPRGACCLLTPAGGVGPTCVILTKAECEARNGRYTGDSSICTAGRCLPPTGACCFDTNAAAAVCRVLTKDECEAQNGRYTGDSSICTAARCQPTTGACCTYELSGKGTCTILTPDDCRAQGGRFLGLGIACSETSCPDITPRGRCCLRSGECAVTTEERCKLGGGRWDGVSTTCASTDFVCHPACPCDWNNDGVVDEYDLRLFINDFFAGHADFNHNGVTNNDDLFEYVRCWTNPPADCNAPRVGACCISGFAGWLCTVTTREECLAATGGQYLGDGVPCAKVRCPVPLGACCTLSSTGFICRVTTQNDCGRGIWRGDNTSCVARICPVITPNSTAVAK